MTDQEQPNATAARQPLDTPRLLAMIASLIGALGSVALTIRASQRTPPFLLVLMSIWVAGPFLILLFANAISERWSTATRVTLYAATLILMVVCQTIYYLTDRLRPATAPPGFFFVLIPPVSVLLTAVAVAVSGATQRSVSR
jgi:hypothetical protein